MISATSTSAPELRDHRPAQSLLAADVLAGLARQPKRLAPVYLYDETGSRLFEQICGLPEYYLTRTEIRILETAAAEIAGCCGEDALLIEPGSGASLKTRLLLNRLARPAGYVPVDISRSHLLAAARAIAVAYPHLEVLPVCTDFTEAFAVPQPGRTPRRTVLFFPGSTIGNFDTAEAIDLLRVMRGIAGNDGALILGVDLVKDVARMERAYNDASGVTAAFNLNVLTRLNREFGADFDVGHFRHEAVWVPQASRIEMRLVSKRRQTVMLGMHAVEFAEGERLVTEHCYKYTPESLADLAGRAGWTVRRMWTDPHRDFGIQFLEADEAGGTAPLSH